MNLNQVFDRTNRATGVSHSLAVKIKTRKDVKNWSHESGTILSKPKLKWSLINLLYWFAKLGDLAEVKLPAVDTIFQRLTSLTFSDVQYLSLVLVQQYLWWTTI